MMRKTKLVGIMATLVFAASCKKEDVTKPVVSDLEVGANDTIHAGDGIHLDFYAEDNEELDYYRIVIHPEDEDEHKSLRMEDDEAFEFDSTFYANFNGLKNATVHHHEIMVPEHAEEGHYHFDLTVADKAGNTTEEEVDLVLSHEDHEDDDEHDH